MTEKVTYTALIIGLMLLLPPLQIAAAQTNAPTDRELMAGYCLGVTKARQEWLVSEPPIPEVQTKEIQESAQREEQRLERDRQRFLGYLLSDVHMDWTGVLIASRNGEADVHDAMAEGTTVCLLNLPTLQEEQKYGAKWAIEETAKRWKLSEECDVRIPARQRLIRCDQPNLLPF